MSGSGNSLVRLRDIADINITYDDSSIRRLGMYERDGYAFLTLSVNKNDGDNVFRVSRQSKDALEQYLETTP